MRSFRFFSTIVSGIRGLPFFGIFFAPSTAYFRVSSLNFFWRKFYMILPSQRSSASHSLKKGVVLIHVFIDMLFVTRNQFQVFRTIVVLDSIKVMNHFMGFQISANFFLDNKTMFKNISLVIRKRMLGRMYADIPEAVFYPSSFPSWSVCTNMIPRPTFLRTIFSYFSTDKGLMTFFTNFRIIHIYSLA